MSVLAHVILGGSLQNEPAATQALAFILNQEPAMVLTICRMLDIEFDPGRVTAEEADDGSRVDLTIYDSEGEARILIENKFGAGLTDSQPISYIDKLPEKQSALFFIVPEKLMPTIWKKLKFRCNDRQRNFISDKEEGVIFQAQVADENLSVKNLFLTSWRHILSQLSEQADSMGNKQIKQDILQFRGLTDKIDGEAFLPLQEDEVSDQQVARRIIDYASLIDEIIHKVEGVVETTHINSSNAFEGPYLGRYFVLHRRFLVRLRLSFKHWKVWGITPLWLTFDEAKLSRSDENKCYWNDGKPAYKRIERILKDPMIEKERDYLYKPILLKIGSERENVVRDAASSIVDIAEKLKQEYYAD